jgi:TolC family type I secretion outer membrane protein
VGLARRWAVGVALIGLIPIAGARADTVTEALVQAYLGNAQLQAGRAQLRATDELVPQALSGWRPQVFGSLGIEGTTGSAGTGSGQSESINQTEKSANLTVQQNLYNGGGTIAATSQAENLVRAQRANLISLEQQTLLDALNAYTEAWRTKATLDLALNNEDRLRRQLQATQDRFNVGEVARTDVAQAEASLAGAHADVEVAKANLSAANATYLQVIGHAPKNLMQPKPLKDLPVTIGDAQAIAAANPDIIAASFNLAAARDNVDVAFAQLLPSLNVQGQVSAIDQPTPNVPWQNAASLGVTLTIPLYQGGAEYSKVRQNRQSVQQGRGTLENAHRTVTQTVTSSWDRLLAATATIQSLRSQVRANQIALQGVQEEALVGSRTVLDVLDAEQTLFQSQVNLVTAQASEVVASYTLKSAVGQLTAVGVRLPVKPYDPDAYYTRNRNRLFGIDTTTPARTPARK